MRIRAGHDRNVFDRKGDLEVRTERLSYLLERSTFSESVTLYILQDVFVVYLDGFNTSLENVVFP